MIRYRNPATPRSVAIASTVGAVALATTLFLAAVAAHADSRSPEFGPRQLERIFTLSPLPPPVPDTSNAAEGHPAAIELGRRLFEDPRLSRRGEHSCRTCHEPERAWTDGRSIAVAAGVGVRNTPTLWNVAHNRWFFWDGRADSLWSQALKPIESAAELDGSRLAAVHLVRADVELASLYAEVFGALPQLSDAERFPASGGPLAADAARQLAWWGMAPEDRETINGIFANVGKSIAAFETTLTTGAAPFDRFVADLKAGRQESDAMSQAAQRGLEIFIGRGNCVLCHSGPYLTNKEFHDIRVAPLADEALFDPGRLAGVEQLFADEFVAAGPHSDDRGGVRAQQVLYLDRDVALLGHFKTPSLRNVALTAPYMHQGQLATLRDVVRHYATLEDAVPPADPAHVEVLVRPFELSERDAADLVAFLEALTSPGAVAGR